MTARDDETAALLALLRTSGHSWGSVASEVAYLGSAVSLLAQSDADGLFQSEATDRAMEEAAQEVASWHGRGLQWVTVLDSSYPSRLRDIRECPPFLFFAGELLETDAGMSIVGSRKASLQAIEFAAEASRLLSSVGFAVFSGLAEGIDTAAHRAALDVGGRTVAFLGTGITRSYPASNRSLQDEIAERGLLLSQFYPDSSPTKRSFPMRNATMSGYGLATIVVEAGEHSGTRIQARVAGEHGRPVILTRQVAETTSWGRRLASSPNVSVVSGLEDLRHEIDRLAAGPQDVSTALEVLTGA